MTYHAEGVVASYPYTFDVDENDIGTVVAFIYDQMQIIDDKKQEVLNELSSLRREKQPLEFPSAGSTFKRPEGHYAGKLIMEAGLGGFRIGDAQVSEKHCGFVINLGHATSSDLLALITTIQDRVYETSGVRLEMEVICLGDF